MTNSPKIIRHRRSSQTTNPPETNAPVVDTPNPNSEAIAAEAAPPPVASDSLNDIDSFMPDSEPSGSATQHRYSNAIDEIRDDLRLDRLQAFDDEQEGNSENDPEGFSHNVSDEYLDFLLSFE